MSRNYKSHNLQGMYFVSFAVVYWKDVFTRNEYNLEYIIDRTTRCNRAAAVVSGWCLENSDWW